MTSVGECTGEHFCCLVNGDPCPHSRDDGPDAQRRYVCTLREELGSWEAVHADPRYQAFPGSVWDGFIAEGRQTVHCGDYPTIRCAACGFDIKQVSIRADR